MKTMFIGLCAFIAGVAMNDLVERRPTYNSYRPHFQDLSTLQLLFHYWDDHDNLMKFIAQGLHVVGDRMGGEENGRKYLGNLRDELTEICHRLNHDKPLTDDELKSQVTFADNWLKVHERPEEYH